VRTRPKFVGALKDLLRVRDDVPACASSMRGREHASPNMGSTVVSRSDHDRAALVPVGAALTVLNKGTDIAKKGRRRPRRLRPYRPSRLLRFQAPPSWYQVPPAAFAITARRKRVLDVGLPLGMAVGLRDLRVQRVTVAVLIRHQRRHLSRAPAAVLRWRRERPHARPPSTRSRRMRSRASAVRCDWRASPRPRALQAY